MTNLYDFTDTAGLPDDLVKRLNSGGVVNPNIDYFAKIVEAAAAAGVASLSISQIEAIAWKMGMTTVPAQQTIRNALNAAVKANRLVKPTRQTYGVPTPDATAPAAPVVLTAIPDATAPAPVDEVDPLA